MATAPGHDGRAGDRRGAWAAGRSAGRFAARGERVRSTSELRPPDARRPAEPQRIPHHHGRRPHSRQPTGASRKPSRTLSNPSAGRMSGGRIEAQPGLLHGGAGQAGQLGVELVGHRLRLSSASALAGAAGAPGARAAITESCRAWGLAIEALEQQAAALGRNLQGAGDAYLQTDASAMPGSRG